MLFWYRARAGARLTTTILHLISQTHVSHEVCGVACFWSVKSYDLFIGSGFEVRKKNSDEGGIRVINYWTCSFISRRMQAPTPGLVVAGTVTMPAGSHARLAVGRSHSACSHICL